MIQAFYGGASSLRARQTTMETISNDIANVSTAGYEQKEAQFDDLLYTSMVHPESPDYASDLTGSGSKVADITTDTSAGSLTETGSALDFAPKAEGYFAVRDAQGNISYTRDGQFQATTQNGVTTLTDSQGRTVLDADGNAITVENGSPQGTPGVFTFAHAEKLTSQGDNRYTQSASSGAAQASNEGVEQGVYEASNVDLSSEMADMIVTQRGFQMSARVVSTADQIEEYVNGLH